MSLRLPFRALGKPRLPALDRRIHRRAVARELVGPNTRGARAHRRSPSVLTHVEAVYPPSALAERATPTSCSPSPSTSMATCRQSMSPRSGGDDLDQAAIVAVRQWTFVPAKRDGKPVSSRIRIPFHFAPPCGSARDRRAEAGRRARAPRAAGSSWSRGRWVERTRQPGKPGHRGHRPRAPRPAEPRRVRLQSRASASSRACREATRPSCSSSRPASCSPTRAARATPSRSSCAASTRARGRTSSSRSAACRSTRAATCTATATPTRTSSSPSWSSRSAWSRGRSIRGRATTPSPAAPTTSSASSSAGSPRSTRAAASARSGCSSSGARRARARTRSRGAELYQTDGFGQNRDAQRASGDGAVRGRARRPTARTASRAGATRPTSTAPASSARTTIDAGRIGFYDTYDLTSSRASRSAGRRRLALLARGRPRDAASGDVDAHAAGLRRFSATMRLRENFTGLPARRAGAAPDDPRAARRPARSRRHEASRSARAARRACTATALRAAAGARARLLRARRQRRRGTQQRIEAATGAPVHDRDRSSTRSSATSASTPTRTCARSPWLTLRGGVRADLFTFDVLDNCAVHDVAHPSTDEPARRRELPRSAGLRPPPRAEPARRRPRARRSCRARRCSSARSAASRFSVSYGKGVRSIDPSYITQDVKTPFASVIAVRGRRRRTPAQIGERRRSSRGRSSSRPTSIAISSSARPRAATSSAAARRAPGWVGRAARSPGACFDEAANVTLVQSTFDDTHLLVAVRARRRRALGHGALQRAPVHDRG